MSQHRGTTPTASPSNGNREEAIYQYQIKDNKPTATLLKSNRQEIEAQASTHQIDPDLIDTVLLHENRGNRDGFQPGYIKKSAVWLGTAKQNLWDSGISDPTNQQILDRFYLNKGGKDGQDAKRAGWTLDQLKAGEITSRKGESERKVASTGTSAGEGPKSGAPFPDFVVSKLKTLAPMVSKSFNHSNPIAQMATLKLIGEEYSKRTGRKGAWDAFQDFNASTGMGGFDFGFRDPKTHLPTLAIPEEWRRGTDLQKIITQADFLHHDVGPANINIKSAAQLAGMIEPEDINKLGKYLTTDEGNAKYAARFIAKAQKDLAPFLKGMSDERQVQIITDYARTGSDGFWHRTVARTKNLTPAQVDEWRKAPDTFKGPDGKAPAQLGPNPDNYILQHFEQIKSLMGETKQ